MGSNLVKLIIFLKELVVVDIVSIVSTPISLDLLITSLKFSCNGEWSK
jgi:hypothetical protein